jgi:predicted nuclease of predicted toxin-antitoxin system
MKFLADENFPLMSVRLLRGKGHDVLAVAEVCAGADDCEVLRLAIHEQRILLTFDRDFGNLVFRHRVKGVAGVVYFRLIPQTPDEPAIRLLQWLNAGLTLQGKWTVLETHRVRQHPLP